MCVDPEVDADTEEDDNDDESCARAPEGAKTSSSALCSALSPSATSLSAFVRRKGSGTCADLRAKLALHAPSGDLKRRRGEGEQDGELDCEQNDVDRERETDIGQRRQLLSATSPTALAPAR